MVAAQDSGGLTTHGAPAADDGIDAPGSSAGKGQIQEDEAKNDRQLTAIHDREECAWHVNREVRHRHLTADDECDRSREQPDEQQETAEELENARESGLREQRQWRDRSRATAWRIVKQLLAPVLHEDQCRDDAQHTQYNVAPSVTSGFEHVHGSLGV